MSERTPRITAKELGRVLSRAGFVKVDQTGSHQKFRHPDGRQCIVPYHSKRTIPIKTLKNILEGAELTIKQLKKLL